MGRRRALSAVSVAGLAVVLTGCMKMDVDLTFNEDDTVEGEMIVGLDRQLAEMSGDSEAMIEEMLAQEDIPEGASAERYEDDDYLGTRYIFEGQSLDTFGGDEGAEDTLSVVREGDEFVVTGTMDLSQATDENMGEMAGLGEGILDSFDLRVALTFPGEVTESTGEIDGNTVVWEPTAGEVVDISARADASPSGVGGLPIWAWIVIGVVVVAALVGLFFVIRRSNSSGDDTAPATAAYAGAPSAAPQAGQGETWGSPESQAPQTSGFAAPANEPPAPPAPTPEQPTTEQPTAEQWSAPAADESTAPPAPEPPTTAEPGTSGSWAAPEGGDVQDAGSDESPEPPRPRDG